MMSESQQNPDNEKKLDWRIDSVFYATRDIPESIAGIAVAAGSPLAKHATIKGSGDELIGFVAPNATALALNIAMDASIKSVDVYQLIEFEEAFNLDGTVRGKSVRIDKVRPLFDYFEICTTTIVFSFLALETFANWEIANKVNGVMKIKRGKKEEDLDVEQIERKLSTAEKLDIVMPTICDAPSPKKSIIWNDFEQLKRDRDAIVHFKSFNQYPNIRPDKQLDRNSLFYVLLNNKMSFYPKTAIGLISYFYKNSDIPQWLEIPLEFAKNN